MSAKGDGGDFDGTIGHPQMRLDFGAKASRAEAATPKPTYDPSPKHDPKHSWSGAAINPIRSHEEGQRLLDTGFKLGKQIYNITDRGQVVKFQPGGDPDNGYHSYAVKSDDDIPNKVRRWLLSNGKISKARYNKMRKNKEK